MKKNILYIAMALMSICACQKENTWKEVEGTPMTFSAVIAGNEQTKASFSDEEGSALKFAWDAEERISVISFDSKHQVLAVDTFTSKGEAGRSRADFTGTLTKVEGVDHLECFYPELVNNGSNQYMEETTGHHFYWIQKNSQYSQHTSSYCYRGSSRTEHIGRYAFMAGQFMSVQDIEFVEFHHLKSVVKVNLKTPEALVGDKWVSIHIEGYNGTSNRYIAGNGWGYSSFLYGDPLVTGGGPTNELSIYHSSGVDIDSSRTITEYIVAKLTNVSAGNTLSITVNTTNGKTLNAKLDMTKDVNFQTGIMYTIHADLAIVTN